MLIRIDGVSATGIRGWEQTLSRVESYRPRGCACRVRQFADFVVRWSRYAYIPAHFRLTDPIWRPAAIRIVLERVENALDESTQLLGVKRLCQIAVRTGSVAV